MEIWYEKKWHFTYVEKIFYGVIRLQKNNADGKRISQEDNNE